MKVICFGDSNTYGYDPRGYFGGRYDADSRWVDILAAQTGWTISNMGQNGREIPSSSPTFPDDTDPLIVMLGTNDLLQGRSPEQAAERMERFLSGISLDRKKILLIAPPPVALGAWVPNQQLIDDSHTFAQLCQSLAERMGVRFADAGHLLGSACITVTATENGETKKIIFSGDLGNVDQPIIRDPSHFAGADYVIMESTYGNRNHTEVWSYTDDLAQIIDETMAKGGNVVIPAFAVGRTQELLYFIREIKDKGLVKSNPDFPVYIDSPLARRATTIFTGDLDGYLDADALALVQDGTHMFNFTNLHMTETVEESKALNEDGVPKVIISASGMCDAGRIRHHLKHNLWRPECTVVFVGYQGEGTLGRSLLEGAKTVKLFGEEIAVHAKIVNFQGLSSHADRDHLLAWIADIKAPKPQHVFIVHGDREVAPYFAESVEKLGFTAHAPQYTEVYDLLTDKSVENGYLPERKAKAVGGQRVNTAYERLVALGQRLLDVIRRSKGRDNRTLGRWADQLRQLLDKWEES